MLRLRLATVSCLLAAIVAVTPALPCLLTCAAEGHTAHLHGHGRTGADEAMPCHHQLPTPLGSVVSTLAATTMLPPAASPALPVPLETLGTAVAVWSPPPVPAPIPDPPPPRLG